MGKSTIIEHYCDICLNTFNRESLTTNINFRFDIINIITDSKNDDDRIPREIHKYELCENCKTKLQNFLKDLIEESKCN